MKRLRLPLSLALLCVLAVTTAAPADAHARTPSKRMIDGVNWWRASAGLKTLRASRNLTRSSTRRSRRLIRQDYFAHPARLRVPLFERVGEVLELHSGRRARIRRTLRRWSRSPSHRHVLLNPRYRYIGAGLATGSYQGQRATIWVVRVGAK